MSAGMNNKMKAPMFLALLGTLAFSVSSIPGRAAQSSYSTVTLSSLVEETIASGDGADTSGCDLAQGLHDSASGGSCNAQQTVDGVDVTGLIKVQQVTSENIDYMAEGHPTVKQTYLEVTMDLETGSENSSPSHSSFKAQLSDLENLNDLVKAAFAKKAKALAAADIKTKKEQEDYDNAVQKVQDQIDNCEIKANGHTAAEIEEGQFEAKSMPESGKLSCQTKTLNRLSGDDKAGYFTDNILPQIQALVNSGDPQSLMIAHQMMNSLYAKSGGNAVINNSLKDLYVYASAQASAQYYANQINSINPADPMAQQRLQMLKSQAQNVQTKNDWYFYNRGVNANALSSGDSDFADYGYDMAQALIAYRSNMDSSFAQITGQQGATTQQATVTDANGNVVSNPQTQVVTDPTNVRTDGASLNTGATTRSIVLPAPQGTQGQPQTQVVNSAAAIPAVGTPVN